ncbi:MAG: hypothetical protein OHK0021_19400 [Bryobacter sp.]
MLRRHFALVALCLFSLPLSLSSQSQPKLKEIKPGWNFFSKDQDVQMGREYAQQIEKQVEVLPPGPLENYIQELGGKMAGLPEAGGFPYVFKVVNDPSINAFALPGGPIYIHTGIITSADNEGQIVGVMAHEISHVALRHSTNQVTKSYAIQIPAMIAGVYGQSKGGLTGMLTQLGVGLGANGILMKFSRGAETQADLLGTRMMHKIGYNPIDMARFFEKLEAMGGKGGPEFFSSHPNPGNRSKRVSEEITLLPRANYTASTGRFEQMKQMAAKLPTPKKKPAGAANGAEPPNQPKPNGDGSRTWTGDGFRVSYPDAWVSYGEPNAPAVTLTPRDGVVQGRDNQPHIVRGVIVSHYEDDDNRFDFRADTERLIRNIMQQNPSMGNQQPRIVRNKVNNRNVYVARLTSQSALDGSKEIDTVVTFEHGGGMLYAVFIAPEAEARNFQNVFDKVLASITLN